MTCKVAFAAVDSVLSLKILDAGVPKEKLALLAVPLTPIQIVMPIFLAPFTNGSQPLNLWLKAYLPRIAMGLGMTVFVYYTPAMIQVQTISGFKHSLRRNTFRVGVLDLVIFRR